MRKLGFLPLIAAPLLVLPGPATAQEGEAPQMYHIYQEFVKPPMAEKYEAAAKSWIATMATMPEAAGIQFTALSGPEVGYIFVTPVDGFAGIDAVNQSWEAVMQGMDEQKMAEMMSMSEGAVDHVSVYTIKLRPDLSYKLEMTELTEERPYRHYAWWYAIPGKEMQLEGVAKEFIELYETNGIGTGWRIYQAVTGPDLPLYLVVFSAKDEAEYYTRDQKINEKLGDADEMLIQKAMKFARRIEFSHSWIRPDLSFPQPGMRVSQ